MIATRRTIPFALGLALGLPCIAAASPQAVRSSLPSYVLAQRTGLRLAASVRGCAVISGATVTTPLASGQPYRKVRFTIHRRAGRARGVQRARTVKLEERAGRQLARYVSGPLPPGSYRITASYPGDPARSAAGPVRRVVRVPGRCRTRS